MRPLADWKFDSSRPLQTKRGTAQALRVGLDKVEELVGVGALKVVPIGVRSVRITTDSILEVAKSGHTLAQK
jgi:hypothetical protein